MKLIIQIPCYNEEKTLPQTIADLPREIKGVDKIEIQIIDDGSTDGTLAVARSLNVDHIISFKQNKGLATAFKVGVDNAIANGVDILVNTDADNQYKGHDINRLIEPVLQGNSDMVVGCRPIDDHPEFSYIKKKLQRIGSWVLRKVSKTTVEDAASGFRAYSREALIHINIFSSFSYCMETLIQAGHYNLKISCIKIDVNLKTRESRLFKNLIHYIWQSGRTIINIFLLYRSSQLFTGASLITFILGCGLVARYLYLVFVEGAPQDVFWPSIILAGIMLAISFGFYLTGLLTSLIAANRKISEEILSKLRKDEVCRHID